ncbi:pyrroline-5-carboxylate reductase [Pseudactinotalea sp. HY160]|uniref:pyrroline-5-carboxylate reductase n=1 Tax=Pseudactinotalea sp. HY160 TaxID=2654490 RepID=UPI00128D650C|nr:pyrroline-5-carboxylate reductase [Pseudactinotalea sp. HY160]MPV50468.1 pyrroline-5-carboxylate reductase [Pseudactinotalea sp. HY160]
MVHHVPTVTLIGTGVMGEAILGSLTDAVGADRVRIRDDRPEHGVRVAERYGVTWCESNGEAVEGADVVVIAVKPKDVDALLAQIGPALAAGTVLVSVAAGITTARLARGVGAPVPVVRVMPNTPATIGRGMSVMSPGEHTSDEHLDLVAELLAGTGRVARVDEGRQDAVTAISGSGPAYVFYLIESMARAGVAGGLDPEFALLLARETVAGAAMMAAASEDDPATLRRNVTSPGGTTQAAIAELDARDVRGAIGAAAEKAWLRAAELGRE